MHRLVVPNAQVVFPKSSLTLPGCTQEAVTVSRAARALATMMAFGQQGGIYQVVRMFEELVECVRPFAEFLWSLGRIEIENRQTTTQQLMVF